MLRTTIVSVALAAVSFTSADAADRPGVGPAASWVLPLEASQAATPPASDAALQILQSDQQIRITGEVVDSYLASRIRIQTPQGLGVLGTLQFTWKPDSDVLTIHELAVTRDGKRQDLLGTGSEFTVLRREDRLEQSILTGTLTAVLQPPGLRVGDVVDMRYTLSRHDPVVADTPGGAFFWPNTPIAQARLRLLWPEKLPVRWRASKFMPSSQPVRHDGWFDLNFSASDLVPLLQPTGAPARYSAIRMVELTTFRDWQHLSQRLTPLYQKSSAVAPSSPIRSEAARIRAENKTDAERAAAALRLVQDQIRYVLLAMNDGGLVPATADETWQRRYGDCKAKTVLLLALLQQLGIEAEPVLVSSGFGDGMNERLSAIGLFDHVLVRARIEGKSYWLDGTRTGDRAISRIEPPAFRWALPLTAKGSDLVAITQSAYTEPQVIRTMEIDASKGVSLPAPFRAQMVVFGDAALVLKNGWDNVPAANRDEGLRAFWRNAYHGLTVEKTETTFDESMGKLTWVASGTMQMEWNPQYNTYDPQDMILGYRADFARPAGTDTDAPYRVGFPSYERNTETIILPPQPQQRAFNVTGTDISTTVAGTEFRRKARVDAGKFTAETNVRSIAPEFPAKDAEQAQRALLEMSQNDLYLKKLSNYLPTLDELKPQIGKSLDSAAAYELRGNQWMRRGQNKEAEADFNEALKRNPKAQNALRGRFLLLMNTDRVEESNADARALIALDPDNATTRRFIASTVLLGGDYQQGIDAITPLIEKSGSAEDYYLRASLYAAQDKHELSLADGEKAIEKDPANGASFFLNAGTLRELHRDAEIPALAQRMFRADMSEKTVLTAADLMVSNGQVPKARELVNSRLQIAPSPRLYLLRAQLRDDREGVLADLKAARASDPSRSMMLSTAIELIRHKLYRDALAALAPLEQQFGISFQTANLRGVAQWLLGDRAAAAAAFRIAREDAPDDKSLNDLCWNKAIYNTDLELALAECDAAVKVNPLCAACLDSRGFVLLRLGRFKESVAAYDASLVFPQDGGASLFGRGLAKLQLGERDGAEIDIRLARIFSGRDEHEFETYGVHR